MKRLLIRSGSVLVRLYGTPDRRGAGKRDAFTVTWLMGRHRHRRWFSGPSALARARDFATATATRLANGQHAALALTSDDAASLTRARQLLGPVPVELAAAEYAQARQLLGPVPLLEAARYYATRHAAATPTPFPQAVEDFLAFLATQNLTARHVTSLAHRLRHLATDFQLPLTALHGPALADWFAAQQKTRQWQPQTWNHYRAALLQFTGWCQTRRLLPRDWHEMEALPVQKVVRGEVALLTPEQARALIAAVPARTVPFLALCLWAGMRPAEVLRLDWRDIAFEEGHIAVRKQKVRTAGNRHIPLADNLRAWLMPHRKPAGPVAAEHEPRLREHACGQIGLEWPHDGPRHNYVSARLALTGNIQTVSDESGTSAGTLRRHYINRITAAAARAWFAILPPAAADNVIPMPLHDGGMTELRPNQSQTVQKKTVRA